MRNHLLRATAGNKPAGGTDDNIANVELLLQGEGGSNGQANNAFVDSSASSHSITRVGDPTQGSFSPFSPKGWSGYFDGTSDNLTISDSADFDFGSGDFTVEGWVKPLSNSDAMYFGQWVGLAWLFGVSNGTLQFASYSGGTYYVEDSGVSASTYYNKWTHIAATREGNTLRIFVNGEKKGGDHTISHTFTNSSGNFEIGANSQTSPTQYYNGYISNVRIVKGTALYTSNFTVPSEPLTAVSGTTLLTLQDNRFIDNSASNHSITVNGEAAIKPTSPFSGDRTYQKASYFSGKFDGSGDYLSLGSNSEFAFGTGQFTVEAWVYSNGPQDVNACPVSCGSSGTGTNTWQLDANHPSASHKWYLRLGSQHSTSVESTNNVTHNQWTHIAVSRDSSNVVRLFIDGVLNDTATITNNLNATGPLKIGANRATSRYFDGYISNVRIVKGTAVYTANFTPSTTPLTPIGNTKALTLQDYYLVDHSPTSHSITKYGDFKIVKDSPFSNTTYPVDEHVSWQFDGSNDYINVPDVNFEKTSITQASDLSGFSLAGNYSSVNSVLYFCRSADGINNSGSSFKWQTARRFDKDWSIQVRVGNGNPTHSYIESGFQIGFATSNSTTYHSNGLSLEPQSTRKYSIELSCYGSNSTYIKLYDGSSSTAISSSSNIVNTINLVGEYDYWFDYDHSASTIKIYQASSGGTKPSTPAYTFNNVVFDDTELYTSIGAGHNGYYKADWTLKQWILDDGTSEDFVLGTNDFTVEAWVKFNSINSNDGCIISKHAASIPSWVELRLGSTSGKILTQVSFNGSSWGVSYQSSDSVTIGRWYHIALVRNGSVFTTYIDGVANGTATSSSSVATNTSYNTRIGARGGLDQKLSGYVSNVRVVNGTALYTASFNVPTEPLTAVTGTKLLTLQSGTLVDNSASGHAFTNNGAAVTEVSPFGAALIDRAGSMFFDGNGDYLDLTANLQQTGRFTIEFWFYANSIAQDDTLYVWGNSQTYMNPCRFASTTSLGFYKYGVGLIAETGTNTVQPNQWYHVAVTKNSSNTLSIWLNGVLKDTYSFGSDPYGNTAGVHIGANEVPNQYFNGYISNFRCTSSCLYTSNFTPPTAPLQPITNTKLLLNGNNGGVEDSLGKVNLFTNGPAPEINTSIKKFGTGSIKFDGSNDWLLSKHDPGFNIESGDFTIEGWYYRIGTGRHSIINKRPSSGNSGFELRIEPSTNYPVFYFTGGSSFGTINYSMPSNQWVYIAVVRSGSNAALFVDGQRKASSSSWADGTSNTGSLRLGHGTQVSNDYLNGYLDDFRLTKGVARYDPTQTTHTVPSTTHPTK